MWESQVSQPKSAGCDLGKYSILYIQKSLEGRGSRKDASSYLEKELASGYFLETIAPTTSGFTFSLS